MKGAILCVNLVHSSERRRRKIYTYLHLQSPNFVDQSLIIHLIRISTRASSYLPISVSLCLILKGLWLPPFAMMPQFSIGVHQIALRNRLFVCQESFSVFLCCHLKAESYLEQRFYFPLVL